MRANQLCTKLDANTTFEVTFKFVGVKKQPSVITADVITTMSFCILRHYMAMCIVLKQKTNASTTTLMDCDTTLGPTEANHQQFERQPDVFKWEKIVDIKEVGCNNQ